MVAASTTSLVTVSVPTVGTYARQICVVALAAAVGALRGRAFAPHASPKDTTRHSFTLRLARQVRAATPAPPPLPPHATEAAVVT